VNSDRGGVGDEVVVLVGIVFRRNMTSYKYLYPQR